MRALRLFVAAPSLLHLVSAIPWNEPLPTPQRILADAGWTPRPTEAPGVNGVPKELMRRQQNVIYPPPSNWCGFINGDYANPLTCRVPFTCVNRGAALGCCENTRPGCTNIYTACYNYGDTCGAVCEADDSIRKCSDSAFPYCGTYSFPGGTRLYNCAATMALAASSVEFLNDYYITAIGSTLAPSSAPFSFTRASSASATHPTLSSYTSSSAYTSSSSSSDGGGLSADAIRGIAIGVSLGICLIFILLAIFIVRKRRANRMKRASQPNLPPAYTPGPGMQQPGNPAYQPVSQQDHGYPPTAAGYFGPVPVKDGNGVTPQSPSQGYDPHQRQSVVSTALLSPPSEHGHGSIAGRESVYKNNGPLSPSITEVDGSDRPLPEADSIQRPTSTHQGMVSPMSTGAHSSSPPPPGNFMQQHGIPGYGQQQAQGQRYDGYVAPHSGAHEVAHTQPYLGPHEMPSQRY
ncbi:MAG: hypothetical protein LQ350_004345 [Teloschistes chrysophthalmus]|nr:MAG: hypothetical protein LQ350_004345 [Niorma chrysophthalma]